MEIYIWANALCRRPGSWQYDSTSVLRNDFAYVFSTLARLSQSEIQWAHLRKKEFDKTGTNQIHEAQPDAKEGFEKVKYDNKNIYVSK